PVAAEQAPGEAAVDAAADSAAPAEAAPATDPVASLGDGGDVDAAPASRETNAADAEAETGAGETPPAEAPAISEAEAAAGEETQDALETGDALAPGETEPADEAATPEDAAAGWGRFQPVADLVEAGGPIIIILAALSVVALTIIVVKLVQFTALRVGDRRFIAPVAQMLREGDSAGAFDTLTRRRGVVARVMETAVRGLRESEDEPHVREEVTRVAQVKLDGLERGLPLLSLIATISPLLGLLGTVLGMIEAFQQLETAGDRVDPAILSGGIWEALLTTAAGLTVAIPAAAFFTWLQRAVDVAGQHMEDAATQVFTARIYQPAATPEPAAPIAA
ncbi:MAG: MotA/TolQ/ExbB proton channel family protein, partial [Caulobacterales bacterium]|nr:MotA/TolQ/ExbB proton channel family protein [Caulobacterales bacterium]